MTYKCNRPEEWWRCKKIPRQIARFCMVGGLATALHYAILIFLVHLGSELVLASSIGFCCSALLNYALNRHFTFQSKRRHREALPRFAITALLGLGINAALLWSLVTMGAPHYIMAQIGATIGALIWNFLANRFWTFRSVPVTYKEDVV